MVGAFAQTLRRYTSLNHLAQAARAVLQNTAQISQMLSDLNRVDFANVQVTVLRASPRPGTGARGPGFRPLEKCADPPNAAYRKTGPAPGPGPCFCCMKRVGVEAPTVLGDTRAPLRDHPPGLQALG